jgi:2-dehydro-3-deoxyphosphogluconate aldolase / (4S)-4-hydroxy-2-oxoglutarate aldolase
MAAFDRMTVLNALLKGGLVPLFYHPDVEVAENVVLACIRGGSGVVEFTNRGDGAFQVFTQVLSRVKKSNPQAILGVGSVIDEPTAALYISIGANFIVAPNFNPEVARVCNRRKVAYIPGCLTPSEVSNAEEAGSEIVKIFPGDPALIKAILGPMPWSRLLPASGIEVTRESVLKFIKAGSACLGVGSNLITKEAVAKGDYDSIAANTQNMIEWIREARAS